MIMPDKTFSIDETILYKSISILSKVEKDMDISILYAKTKKHFNNINEFILALDLLYILEVIEVDLDNGVIKKC
ncbi:hypothetical protein CTM97_05280 [Photobacterium phosphoreum]|uniref:Uncharacterized protein n=1 Tax=Photobacterium phosphoreum TaxID=659 RepID=A0A2T3JU28_PHOPO|nr:ABC-three component system middle component 7 [Photobacterium phosphoreum]PSU43051.1 hypothetical protein CTM97_05280 [Photobacterium phosphoreum]PSU52684.1 hypothetical protein C9J18_09055 [Photobacterium phosphoreum]